ncbi:MAG: succinate dehydrogenase, hydrophobic membrane anchor protein [Deltaproteobacteria bacterium]|nr:succinate dehydrogenase, hydrophobic membrane anchor protein [Deltaproteobacteria bacterium]
MRYMGSGRTGAFDWLFQRVTGLALVVILGLHFILMHYVGEGPVTYEKVAHRLTNPYYKAWELLFLGLALYHAMNGAKLIMDDYLHYSTWRTGLTGLLWVVALALFFFGAVTVLSFSYQA